MTAGIPTIRSKFEPRPREADAMNLNDLLLSAFPGAPPPDLPPADRSPRIAGVAADSRRCRRGWLFVAVPGSSADGAQFAADAAERGAVAVVAERRLPLPEEVVQVIVPDARAAIADLAAAYFGHPERGLTAVGITGTNGKTSTSLLLRSILHAAGRPAALFGTIQYEVGARRVPAPTTTPDPVTLMGFLREARDEGIDHAVMEVSSHALVQQRARGIDFAVGVFTNLAPEHLDYHGDLAAYRAAKALLFERLSPKATAVLSAEDPASNHFAARTRARVLRYGRNEASAVRATDATGDMSGIAFTLRMPDGAEAEVRSPLLGTVNVMNMLAAAAAAHALGVGLPEIVRGLTALPRVRGRLEPVEAGQPFAALVDYAHTDHALENVLRNLRAVAGERRIVVVMGCGGDRDRTKRPRMGRVASELSDHVIVTSDNPRSEEPLAIIREITAGMAGRENFEVEPDRRAAIRRAVRAAGPDDVVLVAGKGHETVQIAGGVAMPFDDARVLREEIAKVFGEIASAEGPSGA